MDAVRDAMHKAGAGQSDKYDRVCSYFPVTGSWRPLDGSKPFDGTIGKQSTAAEYKLEMQCEAARVRDAVKAAYDAHPYEEPVINVIPLMDI